MDVVTGGGGFIGSHLVDRLLADGRPVRAIDNFSVGRWRNLAHHEGNPKLETLEADVRDRAALEPAFRHDERVFHLAARADIVPSIVEPADYFTTNVDGTFNVLEAARHSGVRRLLYVASSTCYGVPDSYPTPEDAPIRPQFPYALTKHMGEELVLHWGRTYDLPVIVLRFFNVYGPRARTSGTYGAVFGVFLAQMLAGKPLTIVGDGTQTRDFTFVSDVVDAMVTAAASQYGARCSTRLRRPGQRQPSGRVVEGNGNRPHAKASRRARLHLRRHDPYPRCLGLGPQGWHRGRCGHHVGPHRRLAGRAGVDARDYRLSHV